MAKRRFTRLDALICAILALVIAGGAVWFFFLQEEEVLPPEGKEYDLTLRFTQSTTDPYDFYEVGETLFFFGGEKKVGTITELRSMDKIIEYLYAEKGKFVDVADPERKTIEMKVRVTGTLENSSFKVNGEQLFIGMEFYPQSEKTRSTITVWDIEEVAE